MTVPPSLIVRAKSHFHTLPAIGVDLIIGLNGYIWISKTVKKETRLDGEEVGFGEESGEGVYSGENEVRGGFYFVGCCPSCCEELTLFLSLSLSCLLLPPISDLDRKQDIPASTRRSLTRIALLISLLARHCIPLTLELISEAHDVAVRLVGEEREGLRRLASAAAGSEEGDDTAGVEVLKALAMGRAE